ncbi:hypothetical protein QBC38DRAFT_149796 [Podospora fimiseda]|uniref:Ubiquitin fusion degradation protein n=1 Tax=Podospora fimiseda TaxID=252190 RepID=A0AAN6YLQ0_9PEZI|nr:hypothetical protein QBC38DRAFT_149796 [Podospora fimiseda]
MAKDPQLPTEIQQNALFQLLSNSLVLSHTTPYLSSHDVLKLGATSRGFRFLIYHSPQVFRRLDVSNIKATQLAPPPRSTIGWPNVQVDGDESVTAEDYLSAPLRNVFSKLERLDILRDVQVLTLDGLSVTAGLVHDILNNPSYSVRILSLREVQNLNEHELCQALQYACRRSRPKGTPRLKGLYFFSPRDKSPLEVKETSRCSTPTSPADVAAAWNMRSHTALTTALAEESETWYTRRGQQFSRKLEGDWASTLLACDGIIAFDAVLCGGPRHYNSSAYGKVDLEALRAAGSPIGVPQINVATHAVDGCAGCGSAPEGWTTWGENNFSSDIGRFPLLTPPPLHSSNLSATMCPEGHSVKTRLSTVIQGDQEKARFIPRCFDCLRDRYCSGCHRWWCETCYIGAYGPGGSQSGASNLVSNSLSPNNIENQDSGHRIQHGLCAGGKCSLPCLSNTMDANSEGPA